jgi:CRP-like cAMP-binding protein
MAPIERLLRHTRLYVWPPTSFRRTATERVASVFSRPARSRGVITRDGEELRVITRTPKQLIVKTSKHEYRTKILIGLGSTALYVD